MGRLLGLLLVLFCLTPVGAAGDAVPDWSAWHFMVGAWVGEAAPGQGTGGFTLQPDLQQQVLIRHSHADYPASDKRHAGHHEDLMVIYRERTDTRADYFDNEGHVIRYSLAFNPAGDAVTFLSDVVPGSPRFRLTYTRRSDQELSIRFEISPPGQPEAFQVYLESLCRRSI